MDITALIDQYGLIVVFSGILASAICGLIKIPIVQHIRKSDALNDKNEKKTADKIRNICTLIVGITSVIFVAAWYLATESYNAFLEMRVYAEMLGAFTCAKIIYMLYEGAGKISIKNLLHTIFEALKSKLQKNNDHYKNNTTISVIQTFLRDNVHLPLTDEQLRELESQLNSILKI